MIALMKRGITMFDFNFDWRPDMEVKIEVLDQQHQQLFRIGRDIEQLLRMKCIGVTEIQLLKIVCELRDYAAYHSYQEEKLMKDAGYSGYDQHKKMHDSFSAEIESINMPKLKADPEGQLKLIRDHIQVWVFEHMLVEDMKMADEIRNKLKK